MFFVNIPAAITNMRLAARLGMGFGLVLALLAAVGLFSLYTQNRLSALNRKLLEHPFAVKSAVLNLQIDIRNIQRAMHYLEDVNKASEREAVLQRIRLLEDRAQKAFKIIEARFLGPKEWYLRAERLYTAWRRTCHHARDLALAGRMAEANALNNTQGRQQARLVVATLVELRNFADHMAASVWEETRAARRQAQVLMWVLIGSAVLLGVFFAILITRSVALPARQIALDSQALANGDLTRRITYHSDDEIGQMAQSLRQLLSGIIGEGQSIKNGLRVPMWTTDLGQTITFLNPAAARIAKAVTGLPEDSILGRLKVSEALADQEGLMTRMAEKSLGMDGQGTAEVSFTMAGQEMILLATTSPLMDLDGNLMGTMGVGVDITDRKKADLARHEREAELAAIYDNAPLIMLLVNRDRRVVRMNDLALEFAKYTGAEKMLQQCGQDLVCMGGKLGCLYAQEDQTDCGAGPNCQQCQVNRMVQDTLETGQEHDQVEADLPFMVGGEEKVLTFLLSTTRMKVGAEQHALVILMDITERKQAHEALQRSEIQMRSVLEASPDMIMRFNREGKYTFFKPSPLFPPLMIQSMVGQDMADFEPPELVAERMRLAGEIWRTREPREHTFSVLIDGERYFRWAVYMWWSDEEILATVRDVTERTKLEAQLRQSQKMEAIGTLAGGIAHDFNNILGAIIGYTELMLEDVGSEEPIASELTQVLQAGERAKNLVRQILSFSRGREQEQAPVQVATVAKEALKLLRPIAPSNIDIRTEMTEQDIYVMADPVQIHQIIMNLCTNALQAMENTGGVMEVSLQVLDLGEKEAARYVDLEPGRYQVFSVSDTGVGMDQETMSHIFEPFFSTKGADSGTGLGLSVVHGIAHNHGGTVTAYSEPGEGSTFRVYLPVIQGQVPSTEEEHEQPTPSGQERILLVDDELALVNMYSSFLQRLGYRVTATTSSREALEMFKARPQEFDLVLTDYTMPNLSGADLAQEMLSIRPELPIIISTGFSQHLTEEKAKAIGIRHMVMKPVLGTRLARLIRGVLNGKS